MSRIKEFIDEIIFFCNEYSKTMLLPDRRNLDYCNKIMTQNDIWIYNYCFQFWNDLINNTEEYDYVYSKLGDKESKILFKEIIYKRIMILLNIKYTYLYKQYLTTEEYNYFLLRAKEHYIYTTIDGDVFKYYNYNIITEAKNIAAFLINQYSYNEIVTPKTSNVILDCGASRGEEVFYFKHLSPDARIFSFALLQQEEEIYKKNIKNNNISNCFFYRSVLDSDSNIDVKIIPDGSRSMKSEFGVISMKTLSIDDFIDKNKITGNYFIKMDIEGNEYNALLGSKRLLEDPTTQGAISIYHTPSDIRKISSLILKNREKIFIRQCKDNISECMLYFPALKNEH